MMEFSKKIRIVADCDEVLTYISPIWYKFMVDNYNYYGKYFNLDKDFDLDRDFGKILARKCFYLEREYAKVKSGEGNKAQEIGIPKQILEDYMELINFEDFYPKYCKPSIMAKSLKNLCESSYVTEFHIVSRSLTNNSKGKIKFLSNIFDTIKDKMTIHILDLNEKKSDVINTLGHVDAIFEDELSNIRDIIENCNPCMDLYVPKLGYNKMDEYYIYNASLREISLINYNIY